MSCIVASSNRVSLAYVEETPCQTPFVEDLSSVQLLNYTETPGFSPTLTNVQSNTIRSDRQRGELINVTKSSEGAFTSELQYGAYDDLYAGAFYNTIGSSSTFTGSVDFDHSSDPQTITGTGLPAMGLGAWFRVQDAADATNNGYFKTHETVASTTSSIKLSSQTPISFSETSDTVTIDTAKTLTNGTALHSYTIVQSHEDKLQYFVSNNMYVNQLDLNFAQGEIPTQTFSFLGKQSRLETSDPVTAQVAASTNQVLNPTDHFQKLVLILNDGTVKEDAIVSNFTVSLTNNITPVYGLGSPFAQDLVEGSVGVTGAFTTYLEDADLYNDFFESRTLSIFGILEDTPAAGETNGNAVIVEVPNFKLDSVTVGSPGLDQPVPLDASYTASVDGALGYTVALHLFDAQ